MGSEMCIRDSLSTGGTVWNPLCVIRTGPKNVAVQATTENFMTLFEIIRQSLHEQDCLGESEKRTPPRTLRRRKSNPHHPKGPPGERQYFVKSKNIWMTRTRGGETAPPGRNHLKNRRFLKKQTGNPTSGTTRPRPGAKKKVLTGGNKRSRIVISHDTAPQSGDEDADGDTDSDDLFSE